MSNVNLLNHFRESPLQLFSLTIVFCAELITEHECSAELITECCAEPITAHACCAELITAHECCAELITAHACCADLITAGCADLIDIVQDVPS